LQQLIILYCERLGIRKKALFGLRQLGEETDASIGKKLLSLIKGTGIGFTHLAHMENTIQYNT
jgi:hypothetical protein